MKGLFLFLAVILAALPNGLGAGADVPMAAKRIAFTFDDVPRGPGAFLDLEERAPRLVSELREHHVSQVAFFVNPGRISNSDRDEDRISFYTSAGHVIGDHSFSHPGLSRVSARAYLEDIDRSEDWLRGRPGYRPWFRFPFLDEGGPDKAKRDAIRDGLAARGLRNAHVTVDGSDWNMEQLAIDAKKSGKPIDLEALRALYVETHLQSANFADALALRAVGRSPVHVMLLHETDLAALFIGDLVDALRRDGWEIVPVDQAYADPVYAASPDVEWASGTLIEALAWEKHLPKPRWYERNDLKVANPLFAERVLNEKVR